MRDRRTSLAVPLLVAGAYFMEMLDGTVIATALPSMAETFEVPAVDLNVGMSAYLLTLAVLIPVSGWIADRFGPRQTFATAVAIFTVASIFCGLSDDLTTFTASRVLQGVGGALMVPVGRLVVLRHTDRGDLVRAIALITWPGLVAPILGPPVGGFLTTFASWRWIFLLNVPLGLIALVLALRLIRGEAEDRRTPFDWPGFALSGFACLALMYSVELAARPHVSWSLVATLLGASLLAGWAMVRHARRAAHPLVRFDALSIRTFAVTIWGGSAFRMAISAIPFLMPLMFQLGFGLDAYQAGLLVLAIFAGNLAMKPGTTAVLRRFGFRSTMIVTGLVNAATIFAYALFTPDTPVALIVVLLFIGGMSRSMQFTCVNTLAFADVPAAGMNGANTLFTIVQQISIGLGITLGAVALRLGEALAPAGDLARFHLAFLVIGAIALMALIDTLTLAARAGTEVSGHTPRTK
ncbi:MFS transporter [Zavarzinia compransoris]|uniref:MFS transporter n=1 Tax=Zavarzinia marina TaxID=2911065 RepID=UPI001F17087E|nr:MFS transporter [Zavarzinia marina]MCF4167358.1 MFS transporter [Zavarzinia marina]